MNSSTPPQIENVSTFPPPPPFYKLYLNFGVSEDKATPTPLKPLPPPLPPKEGSHYTQFGQGYSTVDVLPSLEEMGSTQLYPKTDIEPIKELKKLNRSILFNYLQLLETLIENPTNYRSKVEDISLLFINFHHLLNSYRPHEARETLLAIMMEQIKQKNTSNENLRQTLISCKQLLINSFKDLLEQQPNPEIQSDQNINNEDEIQIDKEKLNNSSSGSLNNLNSSISGGDTLKNIKFDNNSYIKNLISDLSSINKPMEM